MKYKLDLVKSNLYFMKSNLYWLNTTCILWYAVGCVRFANRAMRLILPIAESYPPYFSFFLISSQVSLFSILR